MNYSAYALGIFAMALVIGIAELLLPDGHVSKAAKTVFSLVLTLSLIAPIVGSFSGVDVLGGLTVNEISVDDGFVDRISFVGKENLRNKAMAILEENGVKGVEKVECEINDEKKLSSVCVYYSKSGINPLDEHTYISEVKRILSVGLKIDEEVVSVRGG